MTSKPRLATGFFFLPLVLARHNLNEDGVSSRRMMAMPIRIRLTSSL